MVGAEEGTEVDERPEGKLTFEVLSVASSRVEEATWQ